MVCEADDPLARSIFCAATDRPGLGWIDVSEHARYKWPALTGIVFCPEDQVTGFVVGFVAENGAVDAVVGITPKSFQSPHEQSLPVWVVGSGDQHLLVAGADKQLAGVI